MNTYATKICDQNVICRIVDIIFSGNMLAPVGDNKSNGTNRAVQNINMYEKKVVNMMSMGIFFDINIYVLYPQPNIDTTVHNTIYSVRLNIPLTP